MTTRTDVAQWMLAKLDEGHALYQETAVHEIRQRFGDEWVYYNERGNPAISPKVLREFRKLHGGRIEWDKGEKYWWTKRQTT